MTLVNDPKKAGQLAGPKEFFGDGDVNGSTNRFAVYPIHTRFDEVQWLVADAYTIDPLTGYASIIRQEPTKAKAMSGLSSFPVLTNGNGKRTVKENK